MVKLSHVVGSFTTAFALVMSACRVVSVSVAL